MSLSQCLQIPSPMDGQSLDSAKIKTQPEVKEGVKYEIVDMDYQNYLEVKKSVVGKKIKIKPHCCKTEVDQENCQNYQERLKTSPLQDSPLKEKDHNCSQNQEQPSKKIKLRKINLDSELKSMKDTENKHSSSHFDCKDKIDPRNISTAFSRHKKSTHMLSVKREELRHTSKSKRKLEVTVLEERKRSRLNLNHSYCSRISQKHSSSLNKNSVIEYNIPYPCTRNIVIDLFDPKSRINSQSKSKSKQRSISKNSHNTSTKSKLHKSLLKSQHFYDTQQKIKNTMEKLSQYQLVVDYKNKLYIQNTLRSFVYKGEPQCKWVLLVIDQIFKKLRKTSSQ